MSSQAKSHTSPKPSTPAAPLRSAVQSAHDTHPANDCGHLFERGHVSYDTHNADASLNFLPMLHWAHDTHIRNEHGQLLIGGHADHATQPDYAPDQLLLNAQSSNDTHDVDDW